jgi:hypothetical protein
VSLADELLNLRRELAAATSPLQRMQLLARSWRSVRQLSPEQRKQLAKAVGAEGVEGMLDRIAAHKGRVGASFLVPSLEKFRGMDPDALGRLIEALRDPERRRQVLEDSASAVGDVLIGKPTEEPETEQAIDDRVDLEAEAEAVVDGDGERELEDEPEDDEDEAASLPPSADLRPAVPVPLPPLISPRIETVPPPPAPVLAVSVPPSSTPSAPPVPADELEFEDVRSAPTLGRRLALARLAMDETPGWSTDRIRALLDVFPQDWARRRVLVEVLKRGLVEDTSQAIDLIGSLESRASRRWCVSLLLHQREPTETERQALLELR